MTDKGIANTWVVDLMPSARHRRAAAAVTLVMLAGFAAVAPVSGRPLVELNAFFPSLDAIVFVSDLVTAVLLFAQYSIVRSRAILALAAGYLFTAFIVVPHALTFAGAFSPTGLLGSGIQTGSWLFIFWHLGFALSLLAYALLRGARTAETDAERSPAAVVAWTVASMFAIVCALTWLSTGGVDLLPRIVTDHRTLSPFVVYPVGFTILVAAAALLVLVFGRRSVLDLWLMVVALVLILELAFSGLLPTVRFSFGFYAGRTFSLVTSSVVLIVLLAETMRIYAELSRSNAMLQRERNNKLMNLEAMAASIAHEVRQPLAAISISGAAAARFAERSPPDLEEIKDAVRGMAAASHRLSGIIDNLRTLFGRADLPRRPVDLNAVALDVLRVLDTDLRRSEVRTDVRLSGDLPMVTGHRGQLEELVYNLVGNAIDAMQGAGPRRVLTIETERDGGDAIALIITDSGPGVTPGEATTIFDAFVTTKPQGMGLGLAICRMIVERHGGRLTVEPATPRGARFRMTLPLPADGHPTGAAALHAPAGRHARPERHPR